MATYEKLPVKVIAHQYLGEKVKGLCEDPKCFINLDGKSPHVHTIHKGQPVKVEVGDYIIPEPNGINYYPCKAEIFENNHRFISETDE